MTVSNSPVPVPSGRAGSPRQVLIASDSAALRDEVKAVLRAGEVNVREVATGAGVLACVKEELPDLLVCDMQIGNMGGVATCLDLHLEESGGRIGHVPVLLLLDRRPDVFLARRSEAEGWVVKPLDPITLRRAITSVLAGGTFHDESHRPAESAAAQPTVG